MSLSEDIAQRIDLAKELINDANKALNPNNYQEHYETVWKARAEIAFVVAAIELLNKLDSSTDKEQWKEEFTDSLVQVRADRKIKKAFEDTMEMFQELEKIVDIYEFYKKCWCLKEKITILLNIVKPKHKRKSS
ncbi:MAG: hypothetical protein U9O98_06185 [Asgard group archaeon]|nr:hypothetical protein [Asgard group archaeon]